MPPASPVAAISLRELADLAIGTPEVGAVNFTALHTLIVAMLKNLHLQETLIDFQPPAPDLPPRALASSSVPQLPGAKERKRSLSKVTAPQALESQVRDLGGQVQEFSRQLKNIGSQVHGITAHVQHLTQVCGLDVDPRDWLEDRDLASLMLNRPYKGSLKVLKDTPEASVSKTKELLQDVMEDVKTLKEAHLKAQEFSEMMPQKVMERIEVLEKFIKDRDLFLEQVGRKLSLIPGGEEATMVTWEELEQAVTDGWKSSQAASESLTGISKHKGQIPFTSADHLQREAPPQHPSADLEASAGALNPDKISSSRRSSSEYPSKVSLSRDRSRGSSAAGFLGREQHPWARDEAGMARPHHPSVSQYRVDSDHRRSRESYSSAHPRRDEQDTLPGPVQQDLTSARDWPGFVYPDQQNGVYLSQDQVNAGLEQRGLRPPGMDQRALVPLGMDQQGLVKLDIYQQGLVPLGRDQRGLVIHGVDQRVLRGMDQQGLVLPGMDLHSLVSPGMVQHQLLPPLTDQRRLLPAGLMQASADQQSYEQLNVRAPSFIQLATEQYDLVPVGADQRGLVQPSVNQRGLAQPGTDQHGLMQPGTDQHDLVQPGVDQHGLVQPSTDQRGLLQPGADQHGFVLPAVDQHGLMQPGTDQHDLVQPGVDQHGLVQPSTDQRGLLQPGANQLGLVQPGVDQNGLLQPGVDQHGLVQHRVDQHGLVQHRVDQRGLVQSGVDQRGLVQPDTDHRGLLQPGADQLGLVQPGADQCGLVQPSVDQHDLLQPGVYPPGVVQPVGQLGLVQPGADQRGLVQTGTDQRSMVAPGVDQRGPVQPGADQHGLGQTGLYQPDLVQLGADWHGLVQPGAYSPSMAKPGADQQGLVQPGVGQCGLVQPHADQHGLVQHGASQQGLVQTGVDQHVLAQPGVYQRGLVQPGAYKHGLVQPGAYQQGMVQPVAYLPSLAQPSVDQHGLVQPGAGQRSMMQPVLYPSGVAQPGTDQHGLVQPFAYPPSLVQPDAGQFGLVQPGMDQSGLVQTGADQRGLAQPGAYLPGLVQAGTYPRGLVQPGAFPYGFVQPGAYPHGMVQPGADQYRVVQPGMDQHDLARPGADQRGLEQPGADQHALVQPGADQRGLTQPQPGALQRGLVQPGVLQRGFLQPDADQHSLVPGGIDQQSLTPLHPQLRGYPPQHTDSQSLISSRPYQHGLASPGRGQYIQASPLVANQQFVSPRIDQASLVPPETYHLGLVQPGTDQRSPPSLGFTHPDQQHLVSPGRGQHGQADLGLEDPGSRHPSADQLGQVGSAPSAIGQPRFPAQTGSGRDSTFLYKTSSEKMEAQGEQQDSLDKLAPIFPMAVETFRLMGEIVSLYLELKEQMKDLDEEEAGQTDLEKIQYLLSLMVKKTLPPDLQEQLTSVKTLAKEVRQEKAKLDRLQRILEGEGLQEAGKEMKTGQLSLQLGILRVTVADIEKELAELRESQERGKVTMEHSVSEASLYLQDQLDKLRTIIENMLASSSTLLTMSMAPAKTPMTLTPSQIDPEATCPACSLDLSHQVSTLVQRYEQLQDMVSSLAASRPSKKAKLQSQDEELLGHVQSTILQVQGDCEKLNITTSNLIEDHRQKQKDIDVLYQGLEKLEREKANREHLDMKIDGKANKSALAAKVSRVHFDATVEQLNHMMQELVAKMSGQEQDWQKILDKLLAEMDSKLDRLELDPVKQLLEEQWKSLREQLKERSPLSQEDEAATMRRQLLVHFHCLSCDRPLETPLTGQVIPVTPVGPALPGHRSSRPYTVFELEQIRQQSRNLKLGGAFPRGDLSQIERSVGRLRSMHSKMLMDIEKVQIHFGGSVKASSQTIHELLQAQCLGPPCYRRMTDMADYTYPSVPRHCGGSHTLTHPYRRSRLPHLSPGLFPTEEIQIAMKHDKVDILGLDGHIYKGRMDTRLPGILCKETPGVAKHKSKQSRSHGHRHQSLSDNTQLLSWPHSAQLLAGNNPASSRQRKDTLSSSVGLLSQSSLAHPPSPNKMANLPAGSPPGPGMHLDVPPDERLEEPTRGPRSTTAH